MEWSQTFRQGVELRGREGWLGEQTAEAVTAGVGGRADPGRVGRVEGELSLAEAARRHGVSSATVGNWRDRFVDAGKAGMDRSRPGPDGGQSQTERRLRHECEQLKLALAEATVQLRICAVIDYATKYCLAATVTPTSRGQDALGCLRRAVVETERVIGEAPARSPS